MRICLYTETALPKLGGQEWAVDALAQHLQQLGQDVRVLAPHPRRPLRARDASLPYPVERHPRFYSTRRLVAWYRYWLLRLMRRWPFDVLHCHGLYPSGYLAALCKERLRVPLVLTSHGGDVYEGNVRLKRPLLRQRAVRALADADALIAISRFTHERFLALCPHARSVVDIPNGVDLEPFIRPVRQPAEMDAAIRPGQYVLFLGRLKRRKGVDVLLDALVQVPANGTIQLVVAGEGEERPALETQAARLRLTGRVRFVGAVFGQVKSYLLQNAVCLAVPSRQSESFGLVVLESYASGRPVIASTLPGLQDLIQPERTGWLVPPEAPAAWAGVLRHVLTQPPARTLGEFARDVARHYRWEAVARRHLTLYEKLRASAPTRRAG